MVAPAAVVVAAPPTVVAVAAGPVVAEELEVVSEEDETGASLPHAARTAIPTAARAMSRPIEMPLRACRVMLVGPTCCSKTSFGGEYHPIGEPARTWAERRPVGLLTKNGRRHGMS